MNAHALLGLFVVTGATLVCCPIAVGGPTPISGNQAGTLYLTNSPYLVTGDIVVPQNLRVQQLQTASVRRFSTTHFRGLDTECDGRTQQMDQGSAEFQSHGLGGYLVRVHVSGRGSTGHRR